MINPRNVPATAIRSIAFGLWLMSFFTLVWTGISQGGFHGRDYRATLIVFGAVVLVLIWFSIRIYKAAASFPKEMNEEDKLINKKMSRNFGIIFGVEGLAIPVVCGVLSVFGYERFILCGIAMVVGLHFYPLASVFGRTIDYYLATWACLVAGTVTVLLGTNSIADDDAMALLGTGLAMTTSAYGFYMIRSARQFAAI